MPVELIIALVVGLPIVLAGWLVVRAIQSGQRIEELRRRQVRFEGELERMTERLDALAPPPVAERPPAVRPSPPLPASTAPSGGVIEGLRANFPAVPPPAAPGRPPVQTALPGATRSETPIVGSGPGSLAPVMFNWEQFMGVKLFAWIGGFALFLGVVFFVKYAFDHNLIPAEVRVTLGFLAGAGLLAGGAWLQRKRAYTVTAQTLCATGVLILYATTFAGHSFYHFFGTVPAFLLMTAITAAAFWLAVRFHALVVALLGLCGGFLTPVLLSTGEDNPLALFGYLALLDAGLIAVALRKRWNFLTLLGATGTLLLQLAWVAEFFEARQYFAGHKILVAFGVFLGFGGLFAAALAGAKRRGQSDWWFAGSAVLMSLAALGFAFYAQTFGPVGQRPAWLFGYLLCADLCLLALVWLDEKLANLQLVAGAGVFLILAAWTFRHLSNDLLGWALTASFGFALLHSALPVVLARRRPHAPPAWLGQLFPPMALLLTLAPILNLNEASFLVWPFVLLLDVLVIALSVATFSAVAVFAALGITLVAAGFWLARVPADLSGLPAGLLLVAGFAVGFFLAGLWMARKLSIGPGEARGQGPANSLDALWRQAGLPDVTGQLPAFSAVTPFFLLLLTTLRLPLADPSPVFAVALLLVALLLGLTVWSGLDWLPAVGLACVLALEHGWHFTHFQPAAATVPLLWYLGFALAFTAFPFLFGRKLSARVGPWAAAALAGPLHFFLVHQLVRAAWPNDFMGLLPAAFAVPAAAGFVFLRRRIPSDAPQRNALLAWFGGATLFFVTLIFPVQFDRQWLTVGWALEGAALLWLFHRVPHPGLRLTGFALLVTAFVRLALNPAVLAYHPRAATAFFNWYLYAYGLTVACLFLGARRLAPPRHLLLGSDARAVLNSLGTVLAFLLLNVEIADYFTAPGATALTFQFSGQLARDMTYSIAWAVFALGLVIAGIGWRVRAARYAGIALLSVTLIKLFLHDLASLGQLYRIGAFLGVAVIAIVASFLYQRFLAGDTKRTEGVSGTIPPAPSA